jgi:hypothetical protein
MNSCLLQGERITFRFAAYRSFDQCRRRRGATLDAGPAFGHRRRARAAVYIEEYRIAAIASAYQDPLRAAVNLDEALRFIYAFRASYRTA